MAQAERRQRTRWVAGRWWLIAASALVVLPTLWLAGGIWWGTGKGRGVFVLPPPSPLPAAPQESPAPVPATAVAAASLATTWEDPERLGAAVAYLLARGDRRGALAVIARMESGKPATDQALTLVNREFLGAWHLAAATAVRACLASDPGLSPDLRGDLVAYLAACLPEQIQIQSLPAGVGGTRALLLAAQTEAAFLATVGDCPADYAQGLAGRVLAEFPGASPLLGTAATALPWNDLKQSATLHLRGGLLLPLLGERLGQLRAQARKSPAVATWLGAIAVDGEGWRDYLASDDLLADRRHGLAALSPLVRQSWQRDVALRVLEEPGVRGFLAAEDLMDAVWPGEASDSEREGLAQLVIRSEPWQTAMGALDYPLAEAAAGSAVETLLGTSRNDVTGVLRSAASAEQKLLATRAFPWFRVMRTLRVHDTPPFWAGQGHLEPGELALLQGGDKRIGEIAPAAVYECMLRHGSRIEERAARQEVLSGARVYARNRGLTVPAEPIR